MITDKIAVLRLLLITVLSGLIGFERERHGRAAGLRTHMLVGAGSCLMMLTDLHLASVLQNQMHDATRIAAQVVSGIGFLGAGTILRFRASVRGLTTAASLWTVAGLGLAGGAGFYSGAVATTGIVLVVLFAVSRLERAIRKDWYKVLMLESRGSAEDLAEIRKVLSEFDVEIRDFEIKRPETGDVSMVQLHVRLMSQYDEPGILSEVLRLAGTRRAHWV